MALVARRGLGAVGVGLGALIGLACEPLPDPPSGATVPLIAEGSTWRYLDDGSDPGSEWVGLDFDDRAWSRGAGILGFGLGDEATLLRCRADLTTATECPDGAERTLVHYFRHRFDVADPAAYDRLRLGLLKDDGAVVYINGVEVARANLRLGFQGPGVEAAHAVEDPRAWFDYRLPASTVRPGQNVVAAEVHLSDPADPTLGFDLRLVGYDPRRSPVDRQPYVTGVTPERAVIRWRTGDPLGSVVDWGLDPTELRRRVEEPELRTEHRVVLDGLEPGTTYFYRVGDPWDRIDSGLRRFATLPPADLDRPLRLWLVGDPGTGDRQAARVRQAFARYAEGQPPDAWWLLGNLGFENGSDSDLQRGFFDAFPELLATRNPWPILGNHDLKSVRGGVGPWFEAFELPTDAEAGGVPSGTEAYYAVDIGPVHVIALDTASTAAASKEMLDWLRRDLDAADRPWTVVLAHHPPYSAGWRRSDDPEQTRLVSMRHDVVPILEAAGVDLVVSGYNPSYERSFLLHGHSDEADGRVDTGDGREDGDGAYRKARGGPGTVYVVAGSGARQVEGDLDHPAMAVSLLRRGSVVVDLYDRRMSVAFVDAAGQVADRFTLIHEGSAAIPVSDR